MYEYLENVRKEKGEEERKRLIEEGYVPPIDFLDMINIQLEEESQEMSYGKTKKNKKGIRDPAFH